MLFAAAIARLFYWLRLRQVDPFYAQVIPEFDMHLYWTWAESIARGDWLSARVTEGRPFFYSPLYPYFLAVVFKIFGASFDAAHGVQALLGLVPVALVWDTARRLFGRAEALVAGLIAALCGPVLFYEQLLLTEGLLILLHAALVWCLVRGHLSRGRLRWPWFMAGGVATGLASCGRGNILLAAGFLLAAVFLIPYLRSPVIGGEGSSAEKNGEKRDRARARRAVLFAGLFFLGLCLPPLVLALRNGLVSGTWLPTTAHGMNNLYEGNAYDSTGIFTVPPSMHRLIREYGGREHVPWTRELIKSVTSHPEVVPVLLVKKTGLFLSGYEVPNNANYYYKQRYSRWLRWNPLTWAVLLPLAVLGIYFTRRSWREQVALYGYALGFAVSLIVVFILGRYRVPAYVPLFIWSGAGFVGLVRASAERRNRDLAVSLFVFLALVVILLPRWSPAARIVSPDGRTVVRFIRVNDYNNVATAHFRLGDREEAINVLNEARIRYPWEESVVLRLAAAYVEEKAFEKAGALLEEYLAAGGAGWRARLLLADVRARAGRIDEARGLIREVLRQDPENRAAREMLERL